MIIQATIDDREAFAAYSQQVPPLVARFGGKYIAMGHATLLEGSFSPASVVVSQWPDKDTALRFWHSPEYAEMIKLREGTGTFNVMLADGIPQAIDSKGDHA
jgi:uncharacterized protein (DUF1330 family)